MLGALLIAIVLVASAISVRLYTQLASAVSLERTLIAAQQDLDQVVHAQSDLQDAVRSFVATGDAGEYATNMAVFTAALADFERVTTNLRVDRMGASIAEIHAVHAAWTNEVASPLLHDPHRDTKTRETLGSIYVGQLAGDTKRLGGLLSKGLDDTQAELRHRIDEALLGGIASIVVFGFISIVFVMARVQMQGEIERERSIVETLQGAFRTDLDVLPGARVGTAYLSAERDGAIGGDLYDVRRLGDERGLVLVADVSGKGIPAAVNTAFVKYSIGALARGAADPAVVLAEFNRMFLDTVADPSLFVVVFLGMLDGAALNLTYASAGHSGAYVKRGDTVRQLDVTGPMIGLDPSFTYERRTLPLERGDVIVLATDGLSEARDRAGDFLGDDGAMAMLAASRESDPQRCADEMVARVRGRGNGTLADDLALLVITIEGIG